MRRFFVFAAVAVTLAGSGPRADAQSRDTGRAQRGSATAKQRAARPRAQLERQVRQQIWRVTRDRVGLSADQMTKLAAVNDRYEPQRRRLVQTERETRRALRVAMIDSTSPGRPRIDEYLDRLLEIQRQRLDLAAAEQKELARFMTPLQRARYQAVQEQIQRRLQPMRRPGAAARGRADTAAGVRRR